jgi:hypothetical protein
MQKNVVSPATPCSGLQGIRVPCTSLQGPKGASEKITAAIRFTAQSSCNGNDETKSCRSRWGLRLKKTCIFRKINSKLQKLSSFSRR